MRINNKNKLSTYYFTILSQLISYEYLKILVIKLKVFSNIIYLSK